MQIVNWGLIRHPMNWITVILMLFIAGIALHLILQGLGFHAGKSMSDQPAGYGPTPQSGQSVSG